MQRFDIHMCLVSEQQTANLLPLLCEDWRPREVVLLITGAMREKADVLRKLARDLGCFVHPIAIDSYDVHSIANRVMDLLSEWRESSICLNLTGGTKLMALGAFEAFSTEADRTVFYLDTANRRIIHLLPEYATEELPELLSLESALRAYGFEVVSRETCTPGARTRKNLTDHLVHNVSVYAKALPTLNFYASNAENDASLTAEVTNRDIRKRGFVRLTRKFEETGMLQWEGPRHLRFASEECRRYVQGGWLEEHVSGIVSGLRNQGVVFDSGVNVKVKSRSGVENELDAAFTAMNRLHLLECKTVNYQSQNRDMKGDQAAYKLDVLRDIMAGAFGRAMLVSYQRLKEPERKRCRDLRIATVEGEGIAKLATRLQEWIES